MEGHYREIMIDLETTGTNPVLNHIIQVSAVRFNLENQTVDAGDMFDRCLLPTGHHRSWAEDTREWWKKQPAILDNILSRGEAPQVVMQELVYFIGRTRSDRPVRLWAKPIHFEWPFLQSYLAEHYGTMPIPYWNCVDLNSWIDGRIPGNVRKDFWQKIPFEGDAHNALHDVLHQIKGAFVAWNA
jgi:hypothetical protein